jgi:formylglycine-generating enzyme required for sulfatase activity
MSEPVQSQTGSLPLALERQVDILCDEFEDALRQGVKPDVDGCLARIDESARRQLLDELMKLVRSYATGEHPLRNTSEVDESQDRSAHVLDASMHGSAAHSFGSTTRMHVQRSIEALQHLNEGAASFQWALEHGELLCIEDIVASAPLETRHNLLRELLRLEMEFRAKRGDTPSLEDYRGRFPDHARLVKYLYFENFVPVRIGEFSIQRLLGSGGFGHVYQGWDSKLSRNVAIKVFRRDPSLTAPLGGLLFEARTAAQLHHPGIVTVYAVLPDADGDEFLVLEYIDGKSLEDLLRGSRLFAHEAATLALTVVQALQHSHQHGLVHRDLKPANILLDQGRCPRVTDFGLALHLTDLRRSPEVAGTLPYMAPEQARGETHRLDARTDLWAVGVTLYRMLAGQLPFSADHRNELLDAICHQEPQDLLHRDPTIPPEMARIVRRCLAKQMSQRYQSAAELADDLTTFLAPIENRLKGERTADLATGAIAIIPKGLRCFDASDREFFLGLVPGPRDREGIPQGVRFWEQRLQECDANHTFRVGLLYGPSGCGKSSLVRAGILPRLPGSIRRIVIESSREGTEARLIGDLRRHFPDMSNELTLAATLAELREGPWLLPGEKLVIVLDQFEQWLHGWQHESPTALIEALRQCDGGHVQALVLVRDDFWMPATRLFQRLDVALAEGFNASAVDLFDRAHAIKVLAAFGVAYGRLEADPTSRALEQQKFLQQAVDELAEDGWVVPVRLCIFAEMVKGRAWSPETLRQVGGMQGLGAAFLEEAFDSRSASPMHRLYRKAARAVLERLLPPAGFDIRGHNVAEVELRVASGYEQSPAEFAALIRCLDQELRLITPSDPEDSNALAPPRPSETSHARSYQLTHDFLVTALRGWLNQTRRQSILGRAELRLAEYASAFASRRSPRQLPSWWEWLSILIFTRQRRWKATERSMMRVATGRYALRGGLAIFAIAILAFGIYDRIAATRAEGLVQALKTSDSRDLPAITRQLVVQSLRVRSQVDAELESQPKNSEQYIRLLLGLAAVGDLRKDEVLSELLRADPQLAVSIAQVLQQGGQLAALAPQLWELAENANTTSDRRLRASAALAQLGAEPSDRWRAIVERLGEEMLRDAAANPAHFGTWVSAFAPVRKWVIAPLHASFVNSKIPDGERTLAATALAAYSASEPSRLLDFALESAPAQLEIFARSLAQYESELRPRVLLEAAAEIPPTATEEQKDRVARRQANSVVLLQGLGEGSLVSPALKHRADPRLRSFVLDHFRQAGAPVEWAEGLLHEKDPGARQAMILAVAFSADPNRLSESISRFSDAVMRLFRDDVDPGVHSAAEWALRRLGKHDALQQTLIELARIGIRPGFSWYVTPSRITMIIITAPGEAVLGSPGSEPGRDDSDEDIWKCDLNWSFAISATEITQQQYRDICPNYSQALNEFAPSANCPANALTWHNAQQFCRLLSEFENVPESEMTLPPIGDARAAPFADFLKRTGYRLPVEAEWEVACRAHTCTPRYYGFAPELLRHYARSIDNSEGHSWPVGELWPNPLGLFDMLGNVSEWCEDVFAKDPSTRTSLVPDLQLPFALARFPLRGNDYGSSGRMLRSANRKFALPNDAPSYARGFRIAHTIRLQDHDDR